jgi:ATP-dependent helicase/DNAse subunit B
LTNRASVVRLLESQRLSARPYSATALQKFAVCPYRFLLAAIHRLEPREEPAALEEMDQLTKGALFHRMQADLEQHLKEKGLLPLKAAQLPQAIKMLDNTVKRIADQAYEDLAPAIDRVWLDAIETIRSDLRTWLEKVAGQDGWVPVHFEFGFGFGAGKGRDPRSSPEPVKLPEGALVHGVVDLIERSEDGQRLRVTDHKTGRDRVTKGIVIGHGEYLQPVLYGLAIEQVLKQTVSEGRLFYCTAEGGFSEHRIPLERRARESLEIVLGAIDSGVETPFLAPAPREGACLYCDYQEVCGPYEEIRIARKNAIPGLVQLKAVRELA